MHESGLGQAWKKRLNMAPLRMGICMGAAHEHAPAETKKVITVTLKCW